MNINQMTTKEVNEKIEKFLARQNLTPHEQLLKAKFMALKSRGISVQDELTKLQQHLKNLETEAFKINGQGELLADLIIHTFIDTGSNGVTTPEKEADHGSASA
jgi:hypothetical protein